MTKVNAERLIQLFQHAEAQFMDEWDSITEKTPIKAAYAKGFLEAFQGAIQITTTYATGKMPEHLAAALMKGEDDEIH